VKNLIPVVFTTGLLFLQSSQACQVPVFRYALERWEADNYHAVILHHAPLNTNQKDALAILERAASPELGDGANLKLHLLDLSSNLAIASKWQSEASTFKPDDQARIVLYYPESTRIKEPLWTGGLNKENVERIVDSPVRRKITSELLAGTSNVWLLIQSGHKSVDLQAETRLRGFLEQARIETKLPDGIIPLEKATQLRSGPDEGPIDMDDVLRSSVPLKIEFKTIAVSRDNPVEEIFLAMLLNHSPRMRSANEEPIAIPVFGRGRVLEGMIGADMTLEHTRGASTYLCAACSCQVKDQNPGLDMLMSVKWADHMLGSLIIEDRVLPPLEGIAELVDHPDVKNPTQKQPVRPSTQNEEAKGSIPISLIFTLSAITILVLFSTVWVRKSSK
jgi:hypothetical protein